MNPIPVIAGGGILLIIPSANMAIDTKINNINRIFFIIQYTFGLKLTY